MGARRCTQEAKMRAVTCAEQCAEKDLAVISAWADKICVIAPGKGSGALITAQQADQSVFDRHNF